MTRRERTITRFALSLPLLCAAGAASAQRLGQGDDGISPWRVVATLLLCLALAVAAAFALRYRIANRGIALFAPAARRLQLIETVRLGPQNNLCVVRYDARDYLIAAGPQGVTVIHSGPSPAPAPSAVADA